MSIVVQVRFNNLPKLSEDAQRLAELAVAKAALDVEGHAKDVVPVDTGNLKNSIQQRDQADSGPLVRYVGTGVEYAVYVEFGTKRMRAQPYLRPAAERVRAGFIRAMRQIADA